MDYRDTVMGPVKPIQGSSRTTLSTHENLSHQKSDSSAQEKLHAIQMDQNKSGSVLSMFSDLSSHNNQPFNTMSHKTRDLPNKQIPVYMDGRAYEPADLISLIQKLKQDIRTYTDHIRWLEEELNQTRVTLNARDRDIDKLKSVLEQKIENTKNNIVTNIITPINEETGQDIQKQALNVTNMEHTVSKFIASDSISANVEPIKIPNESMRIKKQGVSGESLNHQRISGLVHHEKDIWSSGLIREAISNNTFLKHLDLAQIEEIVACMHKKYIPQGCFIIREGEPGDALYVVSEGLLEVYKENKLLGRMDVGRAFGELALLYNCKRTASVRAVTNTSVWTLDRRVFQQIMMASCLHKQEENLKFLQSVPALKNLSQEKMNKLVDVLEYVFYGPNEYIIREGELGDTFYIIKSGKVRVTKLVEGSEESQEIRQLSGGDWFGEKALYKSEKRSANVISMDDGVHLLSLDRSNFIYLIGDLNEIKSKIYDESNLSQYSMISSLMGSQNKTQTPKSHLTAGRDVDLMMTMMMSQQQYQQQQQQHHHHQQQQHHQLHQQLQSVQQAEMNKEADLWANISIDDLEPITVLGVGGFGCVELVIWKKDRTKSFALKRMKKQHIVQTRQQEHICSERQIMLELRCPFVCRLFCTFRDNKFVYMLLEACLGGELWTLLRNRGRFDDIMTRFVVACVLEAFTYLHTQGILYRDLKPENLLLDHKGYVKLCDFGFAKRVGQGRKTWTFCGTPEYVAPEIILNKGHDHSADYWSLGILIFELLTGSPPFTGTDPMKIYNVVLRGIDGVDFPPNQINRTASTLIKRLCAQNPAERLGYGRGGIIDIKQHKYFQGFDWIGLHRGTLAAPIQPVIYGPEDTSNFDKYPQQNELPPDELSGWDVDF